MLIRRPAGGIKGMCGHCTAAGDKEREIRRVVGGAQEGGQVGDGINDALSLEAVGDK